MPQYEVAATNLPSDEFLRAYLECAEWAGLSEEDSDKLQRAANPKWSRKALAAARAECRDFIAYCERERIPLSEDRTRDGHDFYLTRNGHGAGFWDRGYGERGERLSIAAKSFGSAEVWYDSRRARLNFY